MHDSATTAGLNVRSERARCAVIRLPASSRTSATHSETDPRLFSADSDANTAKTHQQHQPSRRFGYRFQHAFDVSAVNAVTGPDVILGFGHRELSGVGRRRLRLDRARTQQLGVADGRIRHDWVCRSSQIAAARGVLTINGPNFGS